MNFRLLNGNKKENIVLILSAVRVILIQLIKIDWMQKRNNPYLSPFGGFILGMIIVFIIAILLVIYAAAWTKS